MERYASLSLWHEGVRNDLTPRSPLNEKDLATEWDVIILGAGYTGLWTALAIAEQDSSRRVLIIEKEIAGFGASGRNGGWVSALFPTSTSALVERHGAEKATALRKAMVDCVPSVGRWATKLGINCDFEQGGTVTL
ncbi:MAG: hypothetical protein RL187_118, partial [Actinomycetota bacterium]